MNNLGMRNNINGQKSPRNEHNLPLTFTNNSSKEISFGKSLIIATIAHPAIVAILWILIHLLIFIFTLLGITLPIFQKPQPQMKDIEFVLVNKAEQPPINKHTKFRSEKNSRAGGKHNPNKPVSMPEPVRTKSAPAQPSAPARKAVKKQQVVHKQSQSKPKQQQQQRHAAQQHAPVPPRPRAVNSYPKPKAGHKSIFSIPIPKTRGLGPMSPRGGPVTSGHMGGSSSSEPSPMMSSGGYSSGSRGHRGSRGYSFSGGSAGNPGAGNEHGTPGIDSLREPDFGAYMSSLQRRIKMNWNPPKGDQSKRVVLLFRISRDGRLLFIRIKQTSGSPEADAAAKAAVELSNPFRALPPEYKGSSIDIDFTFDYNVLNGSVKRR